MKSTSQSEDIIMTLNLSKTFLALSATILLVATCVTLSKMATVQSAVPASQQRALPSEKIDWDVYRQW
jgi:hypothetical protein